MSSFNGIGKGDNSTNGWENKTSGNKEPSWYSDIEQPIKFAMMKTLFPIRIDILNPQWGLRRL